jgi:hypothetical protein
MRYYFHIDPKKLTEQEWLERYVEIQFCLDRLGKIPRG